MYNYKVGISAQEHDDFVKASNQTNLLQSASWAKVKSNWRNERLAIYKGDQMVAAASILIRPLPLGLTMFYIPRGPVMDYSNKELVTYTLQTLKAFGKSQRAIFISFDPHILLKQYRLGETVEENADSLRILQILQDTGVHWKGRTMDIAATIQPRFQANVYTQENLTATFPKHSKRLMKDALNRGVKTKRGTLEDLDAFTQVISLTENRKGIALRNKAYFQNIMTTYGKDAYLHLATVNPTDRLKDYKKQLEQLQKDLADTAPHQKKRLTKLTEQKTSVTKYINELEHYAADYPGEITIAGILSIRFGNTMEMLYAGMNNDFKRFYPQYLLYPQVFEDAYQDSIDWANMGGVEGDLKDGLTKFKANFNPMIEEYIGEFELPVNRLLYKAAGVALQIRQKLRRKY